MLVLTRKQGEVIHVGEGITVKVIKTGKGTVKIGIEAPNHVKVLRGELAEKDAEAAPKVANVAAPLFKQVAGRTAVVDYAGYVTLPQSA